MELAEIYQEHKSMVYNLSLQYVWSAEDAEEITQDVFLKVFESLGKFRSESHLRTWIYRITINTSLDFLKAKKRQKRGGGWKPLFMDAPNWNDKELIPFAHPGIEMESKEKVEEIMRMIFQLPEKQRDAIVLTKIQGESLTDASNLMGVSAKSLENYLLRAKVALRSKLQKNSDTKI